MTIRRILWGGGLKDLLPYVDVLLPNAREATRITGTDDPEIAIQQLAGVVPLVVVKLGQEGALAQRGKRTLHQSFFECRCRGCRRCG